MYRKVAAVWVSLIIMVSSIAILVEIAERVEAPTTLYVGGGGGGNYSTIQEGINAANPGDTVFVYNGTYYESVLVDKTISLVGEDRNITIVNAGGLGDVVLVTANWVNVTGFTMTDGEDAYPIAGITLESVQNCRIFNNNASSNGYYGITLNSAHNNIIENNIAADNMYGIRLDGSDNNYINNNSVSTNYWFGIWLHYTRYNTIRNNTMIQDGIIINGDLIEYWNTHIIDSLNTVSGKPVYFWKNKIGGTIPANAGEIILANCSNVVVENQNLENGSAGVEIGFSTNNTIKNIYTSYQDYGLYIRRSHNNEFINCYITSCYFGIHIEYSDSNSIINNNVILNDWYGIFTSQAGNNLIYHNNFIANPNQARENKGNYWNTSYPLGGNYWSDYGGFDNYKGPNQDILGNDSIGDTPYVIISTYQDNYPLLEPIENYDFLMDGWNLVSIPLIQTNQDLVKVLEFMNGHYDAVQWYDNTVSNDHWKHNMIVKPFGNDLFELNETMSFWIHITQPGDVIFVYNGTTPSSNQTIQLHPGWNMVGYPSLTSYNRTTGLNNLTFDTHIDAIQWYDASTKTWHFMGPDDSFVPGRGYWVHSKVDAEWEVPL